MQAFKGDSGTVPSLEYLAKPPGGSHLIEVILKQHFERIVLISLEHRNDRREALLKSLAAMGLLDDVREVTVVRAVYGELCPPPGFFRAGNGAWGCLMSHMRAVQDAIHDSVDSLLVLEDDLVPATHSERVVHEFMRQVPSDWGQIYLGGEHLKEPVPVRHRSMVLQVANTCRTHAYALRAPAMRPFLQHVCEFTNYASRGVWHIDHQLGLAHEAGLWKTYAPAWWAFGQRGGSSDIAGIINPELWWHPRRYAHELPVLALDSGERVEPEHMGKLLVRRPNGTWRRSGSSPEMDSAAIRKFLDGCAAEALKQGLLPAVELDEERMAMLTCQELGRAIIGYADADVAALAGYPANRLFRHPLNRNRRLPLEAFCRHREPAS